MKSVKIVACIASTLAAIASQADSAKSFADCKLLVQFDKCDLADVGCEKLLADARRAGADGIEIERCI